MSEIRLIVPCTKRKRLPASGLEVGRVMQQQAGGLDALVERWRQQVSRSATEGQTLPAGALYDGNQWSLVAAARQQCPAHLHILSAGLGLLGEGDPVPGYDATFSPGAADTIKAAGMPMREAQQRWWQALSGWRMPGQVGLRSLASLMAAHPGDRYLIVASPPYVQAISTDLLAGAHHLADPQRQLLVVTSGAAATLPASMVLRSQDGMRQSLGGGLLTLNVRLGARVMAHLAGNGHLGRAAQAAQAEVMPGTGTATSSAAMSEAAR